MKKSRRQLIGALSVVSYFAENMDFSFQHNSALIRRIEENYTQPTSGTNSLNINFTASYILSKRLTQLIGALSVVSYFAENMMNWLYLTIKIRIISEPAKD